MNLKCTVSVLLHIIIHVCSYSIKVKIKQGMLIGIRGMTVFDERYYYAFYGVPYARPPIGKLRFKDPKPMRAWKKTLDATNEYHGACAQAHIVHKHGEYGFENCLHLNIYTPNLPETKSRKCAVIVWIHGYSFSSSFSHIHGADFLIDNDLVVVTLSHRIGAFGFLKLNDTDGHANMGLKDIVIGLKWIRRNIGKFGGDYNNITLAGSGSASTFISLLLASKYRKLFSKLILQSGSIFSPSILQGDYRTERSKLQKQIKIAGFKDINSAPTDAIVKASQKIYNSKDLMNFQRPVVPFSPIVEKKSNTSLLMSDVNDIVNNIDKNIPILLGFTSQESISEAIPFIHNPQYLNIFKSFFKFMIPFSNQCQYNYTTKTYKIIGNKIKKWYFKNGITENSINEFLKYLSDLYKYPIYKFIKSLLINDERELYVYKFNYLGKFNVAKATSAAGSNTKIKGASHGDEICYIFKCDPSWESYVKLKKNNDDRDKIFIKQISKLWANFAKTGNPTPSNSFGNLTWLPMTKNDDNVLLLDKHSKLINSKPEQKMFKFWTEIYDKYYERENCEKRKSIAESIKELGDEL